MRRIRIMTNRIALWLSLSIVLVGCASTSERRSLPSGDSERIRAGLLMVGLDRDDFFEEWGPPDRSMSAVSAEQLQARWGIGGGEFFKGKKTLDVWVYEKRGVELFFYDDELVAWHTDKTVEELRTRR
jgi:hypothetical protein